MKKLKFKIYTLGCKVNQYDSNSLSVKFSAAGFVMEKNNADLAIINTCAVTKTAMRKGRQMINRARRENPRAKIVIVGCAVKVYREEVKRWGADLVIEGNNLEQLVEKIFNFQFFPPQRDHVKAAAIFKQFSIFPAAAGPRQGGGNFQTGCNASIALTDKSRYFLKVQDGCRQFCAYCIIPYARGELKSRPAAEVLSEVKQAVAGGIKEVVLCGIHLGQYGIDLKIQDTRYKKQINLVSLLKAMIEISGIERIRLSSIEVNEVTDELIGLMKKERKLCRHLHIPLQAGCDKILKSMNRPYTTKIFAAKINKIRQALPEIAITTDVIVGFPGETEKDFLTTVELCKKMIFSQLHVFSYSAHERAPAAGFPGQLSEGIKADRSGRLQKLSTVLQAAYRKKFTGKKLSVIIDGRSREGHYRGKTEYHFDVEFKDSNRYRPGEMAQAENWQLL